MTRYPIIKLKPGKDEALKRFHPWVFSGAIAEIPSGVTTGEIVNVHNHAGRCIGTGFYEGDTIAVKMLTFAEAPIDQQFWLHKLSLAFRLRESLGLIKNSHTNMYRLVHSEGDNIPGLIIDIYGKTAVIQAHSAGILLHFDQIVAALKTIYGQDIEAVYNKSAGVLERMGRMSVSDGYVFGQANDQNFLENSMVFKVDWETGQKTGFFVDQRENRMMLKGYCHGRRVLNNFSYSGGFSVAALQGGATSVVSVDSSKKAVDLCNENIQLNGFGEPTHQSVCIDAKKYLEQLKGNEFDLIVLDPPAFAKNHHNRHKGLEGYKYINFLAIRNIAPGGLIFTFSCSQAVDRAAFQGAVMAAAIETGRNVKILHHLSQSADHPVSIFHPEGAYLKGLVLQIQ
ncbi:MAG: class I SAM-dependent rRNA methyltransferase [Bacteroidales bacterium]|nr:class I SAM-dependent rRNA methyltransferase [Bacteroidales bacterium]